MKDYRWLLVGLLLLLGSTAHAEGGCPPGLIPASGTDINSCVPIPPGYYSNQQPAQPQPPPSPPPQWASRWGAIATDSIKGVLGIATNVTSKEEAQKTAMADCQANGGTQCKLQNTYGNACVAMVTGDKVFNVGSAANLNEAVQSGMTECSSADTNCHVYYSACSLPVRIR